MALEFLSQHFLNPLGLLSLLGLVPLLAFYFFRPEPEEKVMPSMTFFMENKNSGKVEKAMQKFRQNLLLLLHIIILVALAAAIANLYSQGEGQPESAVVVYDLSASMSDDTGEAMKFARDNLGEENTVVVVGEDVKVPLERVPASRARSYLNSLEPRDVRTDIAGGIETASDYSGTLVVASDLDQSVSQRSATQLLKDISGDGRDVRLMDASESNSWGIVGVEPGKQNTTVEIKNFRETRESVTVNVNGNSFQKVIEPGKTEPVTFSSSSLNRVRLETDALVADNTAYVSVPPERKFKVLLVSDAGNPYLAKALELISFTRVRQVQPPVSDFNADVYIVGKTGSIGTETVKKIENRVKAGASLVVFGQEGLDSKGFDSLPGTLGKQREVSVEVLEPRRMNIGTTQVRKLNKTAGKSLSDPPGALVKRSYGAGEVLLYNIRDEDFRYDFLYPVFWKDVMADLTDRPSLQQLNLKTGEKINESWVRPPGGSRVKREVTATKVGFYNTSAGVYAANLASEDESNTEKPDLQIEQVSEEATDRTFRDMIALLLAGLAVVELLYLRRYGVV
ncbi:MAG: BatA domain-containing protein [Candidatus Nanohaloarchaea archaeon]